MCELHVNVCAFYKALIKSFILITFKKKISFELSLKEPAVLVYATYVCYSN